MNTRKRALRNNKASWNLVIKNMPFVIEAAHRSFKAGWGRYNSSNSLDWNDAKQEAIKGAFRASQLFDKNKATIATYMAYWIKCFVNKEYQKQGFTGEVYPDGKGNRNNRRIFRAPLIQFDELTDLNYDRSRSDTRERQFLAQEANQLDDLELNSNKVHLNKMMNECLSEKERYVLLQSYDDKNFAEIGRDLKLSRERARQIGSEAFLKLKDHYQRNCKYQ